MNLDFPLILVALTALTGIAWLLERLVLRPRRPPDGRVPWLVDAVAPFFPVLLVVLVLRSFVVEPFQIPSGSMIPTLEVGDFILVNKFSYGLRLPVVGTKVVDVGEPKRGDVMVFFPPDDKRYFIKRVIGLPGDEIRVVNNVLYINGTKVPQVPAALDYLELEPGFKVVREQLGEHGYLVRMRRRASEYGVNFHARVPSGHYFMMGDNRDNSYDSRAWGPIPEQNIVGKAFLVWMHWEDFFSLPSFDRVGRIQ